MLDQVASDAAAVVHSLGNPPLPGHEQVAEHYFRAVYERAGAAQALVEAKREQLAAREGKRAARQAISAIKVVAANMVMDVLDRAIQIHGSLGMTDDTPLAALWRFSRMLRLADGPDEVHKMVLARRELNRWSKRAEAERAGALEPRHVRRMV